MGCDRLKSGEKKMVGSGGSLCPEAMKTRGLFMRNDAKEGNICFVCLYRHKSEDLWTDFL